MPWLTFMLVASGSGEAPPFFMLGFVTRMQSLIEASPKMKSTASMRVRRRDCTPAGCRYLLQPEEWQMNARGIVVDWLNCYQPRREDIAVVQSPGFAPFEVSFALLRSALLCLRGSRCALRVR